MGQVRDYFGVNKEKIGRRRYFFANATAYVVYFGVLLAIKPFLASGGSNGVFLLTLFVILFFSTAELYIFVFSGLNRLSDIGVSRWLLILGFIPYVNVLFVLYLCLQKGNSAGVITSNQV